jgi:hypothetical protein
MRFKRKKLLSVLFIICMIWFVGKFFIFGLKASWGIMKLLCTVIFFPVILKKKKEKQLKLRSFYDVILLLKSVQKHGIEGYNDRNTVYATI